MDLDLPEGYTVEPQQAVEEESGESREVLLLRRPDGSVAWVFSFDASSPTAETVTRRAWDDYRSI